MPRRYTLGKRADLRADTGRRIVEAAAELYRERGTTGTSTADIAARADVAPGTVRNHFTTRAALDRAVADHVLARLHLPEPAVFDGIPTAHARLRLLAAEMGAFYERSEPWYRLQQLETEPVETWAEAERGYYTAFDELVRAALQQDATGDAVALVTAVLEPAVFSRMWSTGRSAAETADLIADALSSWLESPGRGVRR